MHEFWYDYVKLKYVEKTKLCYMNTDSVIVYKNTHDIYTTLQKMLKQGLNLQNASLTDHYRKERARKLLV